MIEKIKNLIKKFCTKQIVFYGIFGILTTLINLISFYFFTSILHTNENIANMISIILAVLFAYFTNKNLVFNSQASNIKENLIEFFKFISGRIFTMIIELGGCAILFSILNIPNIIIKTTITIIIIILNFFISKFFAFKK